MSNNVVELSGTLTIAHFETYGEGCQKTATVQGWIDTGNPMLGDRHPFVASGTRAQALLEYMGMNQGSNRDGTCPGIGASARGKLVTLGNKSFLQVKHISCFDISTPLAPERIHYFISNRVRLQGYLSLGSKVLDDFDLMGQSNTLLTGEIATGSTDEGEIHPVMLAGDLAARIDKKFEQINNAVLIVSLAGRLISMPERSCILVEFLSLCDQ